MNDAEEHDPDPSFWCGACGAYHVDPKSYHHHVVELRCKKPCKFPGPGLPSPAPWWWKQAPEGVFIYDALGRTIAEVKFTGHQSESLVGEQLANAVVLAAAPNLRSTLIEARAVLAVALAWPNSSTIRDKIKNAIDAATPQPTTATPHSS